MEAIVAVFSDWGIGSEGTQQLVLKADRAHFRELTAGAAVIVGRRTMEDFPGGSAAGGPVLVPGMRADGLPPDEEAGAPPGAPGRNVLCGNIHCNFRKKHICTYSGSCRDSGFCKNIANYLNCKVMSIHLIKRKIACGINKNFIN